MSGIAGVFQFNESPLREPVLSMLAAGLEGRGPDGGWQISNGQIGMVYRAFHTTAESRNETQPILSRDGQMLAWDGRLDNRDDLLSYFPHGLDGDKSDVAIVMAAYLKWGSDFWSKLVGDFVLSLYDPTSNTLILARDPFGTRTLYYSVHDNDVLWSSTLESLLVAAAVDPEVDDDYVAGYLALHPEMFRTPYKNIAAVVPGHFVTFHDGHTRSERFWKPGPDMDIRYRADAEYEEHFRHLFREAVRCRLRSDRPVWAELSGGLDSSSIVCMADQLMRNGGVSAPRLETVSYIDEDSTTFFDRSFIHSVESLRHKPGRHLQSNKHWVSFVVPEQTFVPKPHPGLCVEGTYNWLDREMRADNARVLLSGLGGDQVLWSLPEAAPQLTDLLHQRRPLLLHRQLKLWSQILKQPYWLVLWQETIVPLLGPTLAAMFQRQLQPAPWLDREFINTRRIKERLVLPADPFGYRLPSSRRQASMVQFIVSSIAEGECWEESICDKTYPFLHRPLVEFLMSIPFEQKLRTTETRSLMRRALKDLLPPNVLKRKSKGIVGETFCRGLADEWPALKPMLTGMRVAQRGYVDAKVFRYAVDLARHGRKLETSTLLKTIALEIWLRSLEHGHIQSRRARWVNAFSAVSSMRRRAAANF
jgi:asparagine synthase (glutamine-hydrolysing)